MGFVSVIRHCVARELGLSNRIITTPKLLDAVYDRRLRFCIFADRRYRLLLDRTVFAFVGRSVGICRIRVLLRLLDAGVHDLITQFDCRELLRRTADLAQRGRYSKSCDGASLDDRRRRIQPRRVVVFQIRELLYRYHARVDERESAAGQRQDEP